MNDNIKKRRSFKQRNDENNIMIANYYDIAYVFAAYPPSFRRVVIRSNKGRSPGLYSSLIKFNEL